MADVHFYLSNRIARLSLLAMAFFLIFGFSLSSQAESKKITHVVLEDETAWFLASVYYGRGQDYPKLLTTNKLERAEDIKVGMEIQIEDPKFFKGQSLFSSRYAKLWDARQKALGLMTGSPLPHSKVVIPTERILNQDQTPRLPLIEVKTLEESRNPAPKHQGAGT